MPVHCTERDLVDRAEAVMRRLREARLSLVTAESCTAGMISAVLSQAEGAGSCLHGSFVVYTKQHKTAALGVPEALLAEVGSVHEKVARRMAEGALARSPADIVLAVTGVTGPAEDEDGNPVGRVVFACGRRGEDLHVEDCNFGRNSSDNLRRLAALHALDLVERAAAG